MGDVRSQKSEKTQKKQRRLGLTPVARGSSGAKAPALAARLSLREDEWELALAYMIRIHLETGPRRVVEANAGTQEQGRELALAYMRRIHVETGPRRVAEAIADTAQIR